MNTTIAVVTHPFSTLMHVDNLAAVTRVLRDLLRTLPVMRQRCSHEVVERHLQLISYYQTLYDRLSRPVVPIGTAQYC